MFVFRKQKHCFVVALLAVCLVYFLVYYKGGDTISNDHADLKPLTSGGDLLNISTKLSTTSETVKSDSGDTRMWCLVTDPVLCEDELKVNTDFIANGQYCMDHNKTFPLDINFNIERSFTFGKNKRHEHINIAEKTSRQPISTTIGIPRTFHCIWSGVVIPNVFVNNLKHFRELHPKWEIHFWTIKYGRKLLEDLEPQLVPLYDGYMSDTARADALRYVLMYHYGGVYMDIDTYPRIPFDNLTVMDDCIVGPEPIEHAFFLLNIKSFLSNAILLCKPKHAFFRYVIHQLPATSKLRSIMTSTGPLFLTNCFNSFGGAHFHNRQYIKGAETIKMTVCRHEYFEFLVQRGSFNIIKSNCGAAMPNVEYFINHCLTGKSVPICDQVRGKDKSNERLLFDACLEWVRHGQEKRDISGSLRYADHVHYQTRNKLKTLKYNNNNNITLLMPDVIVHL